MIGVQRAISLLTSARNGCGPRFDLSGISLPSTEHTLARGVVVERLVERIDQLVEDRLRRRLGREQAVPGGRRNAGSPASAVVGTFGMAGLRAVDAIA